MADKTVMTTDQIDHPVNIYYQRKTLTRVIAAFIYAKWGQSVKMPQHEGDTVKWRRWTNLVAQTVPLVEGEDPTPLLLEKNDLTQVVKEYGVLTKQTSWMKFTGINSDQDEIAGVLLDNMKLTLDTLCRNVCAGTASYSTCSSGSPTTTYLNRTDIDSVVTTLVGQNTKMMTDTVVAGRGQGTSPIRAAFIALGHTNQRPRLDACSGFKHVSNYANQGDIYPDEYGSVGDTRWILSTNGYYDGSTYYHNLILGRNFFGNVKITGNSADKPLIYTPASTYGGLQRYSTLGWLANYACKILNDNFGHVLRSTV